jgi:CheY-like chemotaxis protein
MTPLNILLIEDNEGDILLTTEALTDYKLINKVMVIRDGREAINFFSDSTQTGASPFLVLLDINIPKVNGHQILNFIKNSAGYKDTPVIMLTSSSSATDKMLCEKNNAFSYLTKPLDVPDFLKVIRKIENFWLNIVTNPPSTRN